MNKVELIAAVADKAGISQKDARKAVDSFIEVIKEETAAGNKTQILGFGTFEQRVRNARTGKNPRTGEALEIKAAKVPVFKAGKGFKAVMPKA